MNIGFVFFIISAMLLTFLIIRQPQRIKWISYTFLNIVVAAALLYLLNGLQIIEGLTLPINEWTLLTIALLGVPGMISIIIIKMIIVP